MGEINALEVQASPRQSDDGYRPFSPFHGWAAIRLDGERWNRKRKAIEEFVGVDASMLARAQEVAKRAAAVETGVIEDLYVVERGVTITFATQAAMWEAPHQDLVAARSYIEAQMSAYDFVLDFATKRVPFAESWIRDLHATVCRAQETYKARTEQGEVHRPLPLGAYKTQTNHVLLADGTVHSYAPVEQTAPEMQRLLSEMATTEFLEAHPAVQASYVHHAITSIHPFTDGNGRVARALASVFVYRAASVPLLIFSESRNAYFDALGAADRGDFEPLVRFVLRAGELALDLVRQSLSTATLPSPVEAARLARGVNVTRGGLTFVEIDQAGGNLLKEVLAQLQALFVELSTGGDGVTYNSGLGAAQQGVPNIPEGYRDIGQGAVDRNLISVVLRLPPPGEATVAWTIRYLLPIDGRAEDEILLSCPELSATIGLTIESVWPSFTIGAQLLVRMWLEGISSQHLMRLQAHGEAQRRARGFI